MANHLLPCQAVMSDDSRHSDRLMVIRSQFHCTELVFILSQQRLVHPGSPRMWVSLVQQWLVVFIFPTAGRRRRTPSRHIDRSCFQITQAYGHWLDERSVGEGRISAARTATGQRLTAEHFMWTPERPRRTGLAWLTGGSVYGCGLRPAGDDGRTEGLAGT